MTDLERLDRLRRLARLLDARIGIPGTPLRFGADSLLGLVPGLGDAATALVSLYIIAEAHRLGASQATLARMVWNVLVDTGLGAVPVLGDVFDLFWKANMKNIVLLEKELAGRKATVTPVRR